MCISILYVNVMKVKMCTNCTGKNIRRQLCQCEYVISLYVLIALYITLTS